MIKTFKWIYKLGYDNARNEVFKLIESEKAFHMYQAQIKYLRTDDTREHVSKYITTSKEHDCRAKEANAILNRLDPVKYPNTDPYLELLNK